MPVIQKITYFKDGNEIQLNTANISPMITWVTTLTTDEQSEFAAARTACQQHDQLGESKKQLDETRNQGRDYSVSRQPN